MKNDFSFSICSLPNASLHERIRSLILKEREITLEILEALSVVEKRMLHAEMGFSSLHEYCVKGLGYSEGAAYRRIASMRLIEGLSKEAKEKTEKAITEGKLSLSSISTLHGFFQEEKREGKEIPVSEKEKLLLQIEGKSKREAEEEIARIKPDRVRKDQERVLTETETEVRFTADKILLEKLNRLRALLSHKHPHATYQSLLTEMADFMLKRIDPVEKEERRVKVKATQTELKKESNVSPASPSIARIISSPERSERNTQINQRYIRASIKREIWKKHEGQCCYEDPKTKRRCESRHFLEHEHIQPIAKGGTSERENLRLYCRTHNRLAARNEGVQKVIHSSNRDKSKS